MILPSGPSHTVTRLALKSIVSITPGGAQRSTAAFVARMIAAPRLAGAGLADEALGSCGVADVAGNVSP